MTGQPPDDRCAVNRLIKPLQQGGCNVNMHITGRRVIPILLALVLALAGLGLPAAAQAQQAGVLRIGYLGAPGTAAANGAQLAIDQINSAGGFAAADGQTYQLDLVTLADTPTAESLPSAVAALAAQNVVAMLGPDDGAALTPDNIALLGNTGIPVLTGATDDTLTDDDAANVLFRLRAPEHIYSRALAAVMIEDRGLTSIALVHTDAASTPALLAFMQAMEERGISADAKIQLAEATGLLAETQNLVDRNPEAIVMWGPGEDAATMLSVLRKRGWQGTFAHRHAVEASQTGALPNDLAEGVLGVTSWSYAYPGTATQIFLDDYVTTFGEVPGALSAAAYDAVWYLRSIMRSAGIAPEEIRAGLESGPALALVGGELRPADLGTGDLLDTAIVYELGPGGGPVVLARFNGDARLPVE